MDRIEFEIITLLQKNARLSNKELAARVGLAPSTCLERVRRLQKEGVLRGFHADVEPSALGIGLRAVLFVRLRRNSWKKANTFRTHALSLPEVVAYYNVTGAEDFLVHVVCRDMDHLFNLARDGFAARSEVDRIQTSLVFEAVERPGLPVLVEPAKTKRSGGKG
jgi:DNA-binding Lrp family transcriptional regulator